ncbi:NAD-dependent epimerase/dehydratase family protein [Bacillus paramycoides]|uniref:NAD-dependent epimerase/dehydratase family protein n=1 Tax=Bacillus paramycoides TaxID=2026194 RepID=UPI003CFD334B
MKVLIIGATGYLGSTIVENFKKQNVELYGLARSIESYKKIKRMGISPIKGDIFKPETLKVATEQVDAVIHVAAPGNAFNDGATAFNEDHEAIKTVLDTMKGTNKTFIYSSGAMVIADLQKIGEAAPHMSEEIPAINPPSFVAKRVETENMVLQAADFGIRSIVIRIPHIYGKGKNFMFPFLIDTAMKEKASFYINEGENLISFVHVEDLAELYWLALKNSPAGELYHPASFDMNMKSIALSISDKLGFVVQTNSISFEEAKVLWGEAPSLVFGINANLNSTKATNVLHWIPKYSSIDEEIEEIFKLKYGN